MKVFESSSAVKTGAAEPGGARRPPVQTASSCLVKSGLTDAEASDSTSLHRQMRTCCLKTSTWLFLHGVRLLFCSSA